MDLLHSKIVECRALFEELGPVLERASLPPCPACSIMEVDFLKQMEWQRVSSVKQVDECYHVLRFRMDFAGICATILQLFRS
jgi:hypothetical protein